MIEVKSMIEAIIPVSNKEISRRTIDRLQMLLDSLNFFWSDFDPLRVHIVVPDSELDDITASINEFSRYVKISVFIKAESEISPILGAAPNEFGVMKQMLVKLSSFSIVKSDYALLLDSDVVACKHFGYSDLVRNGRVVTEWLQPTLHEWWLESARVLGYDITAKDLSVSRIFVTPQILCRSIVIPMLEEVESHLHANWMTGLISEYSGIHPKIWTEYTLYDLFAERHGLRDKYHARQDEFADCRLHCMAQSLWGAKQFEGWDPSLAICGDLPGFFLVLQSITAHSLDFDKVRSQWLAAVKRHHIDYNEH